CIFNQQRHRADGTQNTATSPMPSRWLQLFDTVQMTKRKVNFLIILILGLLCVTGSIYSILKDINIDLVKAKNVTGKVTYADTRSIKNFSIRWTTYKQVFYFTLNNSDQKFAIHRSDEIYDDLTSNIKVGDTVKVYYRPTIRDYNIYVFQVEHGDKILASYSDYNKDVSSKTGILLFIGIIMTTGAIMWYRKFNILKFMTGLVNGRQNQKQPTGVLRKAGRQS